MTLGLAGAADQRDRGGRECLLLAPRAPQGQLRPLQRLIERERHREREGEEERERGGGRENERERLKASSDRYNV